MNPRVVRDERRAKHTGRGDEDAIGRIPAARRGKRREFLRHRRRETMATNERLGSGALQPFVHSHAAEIQSSALHVRRDFPEADLGDPQVTVLAGAFDGSALERFKSPWIEHPPVQDVRVEQYPHAR